VRPGTGPSQCGTNWAWPFASAGPILRSMKKRTLAALLWFYAAWYAGAMVAHFAGISEAFGPILGATAAAIVAGDPRHLIWNRRPAAPQPATASATGGATQVGNPA
jgi:hypothetical protein